MNEELHKIVTDSIFLEFFEQKTKYYNLIDKVQIDVCLYYEEDKKVILKRGLLKTICFLILCAILYYNYLDGLPMNVIVLAAIMLFIPLLMFCTVGIDLLLEAYNKISFCFLKRTNTYLRYRKLKNIVQPQIERIRNEIYTYMEKGCKNLLSEIEKFPQNSVRKINFIENYNFLKTAQKFLYIEDLNDFLTENKSTIRSFYKEEKYLEVKEETENAKTNTANNSPKNPGKANLKSSTNISIKKTNRKIVKVQKINWEERNKRNQTIGSVGEELVMLYEKNKLIELELYELIHKVQHVSITQGDGLGYDIISFGSAGKQIYIEVKSTTKNLEGDFFFTRNEIAQMNRLNDAYCLYRVYDLDIENNTGQIEIFYGADTVKAHFDFHTETVRAKFKRN